MKKKLEAELISIAHRILKLKNKSELQQLHQEAQNLYEKLSVLRFVEDHFSDVKPTIGLSAIEEKIEAAFEVKEEQPEPIIETVIESDEEVDEVVIDSAETEEAAIEDEHEVEVIEDEIEVVAETETSEEIIQEEIESEETAELEEAESSEEEETEEPAKEETNFKPAFELSFDTKDEEIEEEIKAEIKAEIKKVSPQITIDDLLGPNYVDPVFVKPEDLAKEVKPDPSDVIPIGRSYNDAAPVISLNKDHEGRSISLNDRMAKGIIIGLNDRIAFMSHLFANSSEDYNRVLSQLMTFDTFEDAKNFIDNMVKPDYNNWQGKEEYAERFMEIVEKKFS
jgi:hypothetical protein